MNTRTLFFTLSAFVALGACKKEEGVVEPDLGYGYFPTKVGSWVEYQVDSMWQDDPSNVRDSVSYRMREKIVDQYTDLEGRPCQKIHRSVLNEAGVWAVRDVWTSTMNSTAAEKTEENYRRLKLSFPIRKSRRWDTNVYSTGSTTASNDELMVGYDKVDVPWANAYMTFPRTVLVKNTVAANYIATRNFEERYALNVGLVEKYWEETTRRVVNNPNGSITLLTIGWRLRLTVVDHGTD